MHSSCNDLKIARFPLSNTERLLSSVFKGRDMEEGWNTNGGKKRQAGTDGNTAQRRKVTGEEGKRVEELFISFVPGAELV